MKDRGVGAIAALLAMACIYGLSHLPAGWAIGGALLAVIGWALGGYIRHLRRMAERDELTGLCNRRPFERQLLTEWTRAERYGRPLSLLFLDVDDFGVINKRFGHLMGDEALKAVCRLIRQNTRRTDTVARWGGEEFVVLLPETDKAQAMVLAERIRAVIEQSPIRDRDRVVAITVSTGVACHPGLARNSTDLLRQAIAGQANAKVSKNAITVVS